MASMLMPPSQDQDLFTALGLGSLPTDEKINFLQKVETAAREQVIALILEKLDDPACRELDALLQKGGTEEDVLIFLHAHITDLDSQVKNRIAEFKQSLISEVAAVRTELEETDLAATSPAAALSPAEASALQQQVADIKQEIKTALEAGRVDKVQELLKKSRQLRARLST